MGYLIPSPFPVPDYIKELRKLGIQQDACGRCRRFIHPTSPCPIYDLSVMECEIREWKSLGLDQQKGSKCQFVNVSFHLKNL